MNTMSPQQIRELRNGLVSKFNSSAGGYFDKIDAICQSEDTLCRSELICIMNPNFEEIFRYHGMKPDFNKYLKIYGKCIYNKFEMGIPEDPISMEPIDVDRVVTIKDYGYDKGTSGRLVTREMKNPITNAPLSIKESVEVEINSALNGSEFLDAMYGR